MKAWDIWSYHPAGWPEPHPAVIVSHPDRVINKPEVNILLCSSKPPTRPPKPSEVVLDQADGLNWPTLCKCDFLVSVEKANLSNFRGHVTDERRTAIIATVNRSFAWVEKVNSV